MQTISHYRLEQELGHGGMGRVYKAFDNTLNRVVVLKLLAPDLIADRDSRNRFLREARLASALDHANICTIYEIAEAEGQYFIAMQYLPGRTLKKVVGGRALDVDSLLSIALQMADAIAAAHARGIVHRDIKSTNIIISPRGQAKILDFGLAKLQPEKDRAPARRGQEADLTKLGTPLGTPSYMSPEQARGERVDHRSDIFSYGAVLYEMATGEVPFKGKSQVEIMNAVMTESHVPAIELNKKIPAQLSGLIDRALGKRPADRYQTMWQIIEDLRKIAFSVRLSSQDIPDGVTVPFVRPRRQTFFGSVGRWLSRLVGSESSWEVVSSSPSQLLEHREQSKTQEFSLTSGPARTLAVLPFRNLSGDAAADLYGMSLADSLATELARFKSLIVRSSSATAKYHSQQVDLAQVGREIEVDTVLTGNFLRADGKMRVTAQLIDTSNGQILWSEKIDAPAQDPLSIQDRICQEIISGLSSGQVAVDPTELLKDENEEIRLDAVRMLRFSHDPRALSVLIDALRDPSPRVKGGAVKGLVVIGEQATGPVIRLLHDSMDEGDDLTARFAAKALGMIGDRSISSVLIELLRSTDTFVACEAALALGRLGETKAVLELIGLLEDRSGNLRFAAAEALGQISDPRSYDALQYRLKDEDEGVRAKARWALSRLKQGYTPAATITAS